MAHHKTAHWTFNMQSDPRYQAAIRAALDNHDSTYWYNKAIENRDRLGRLAISREWWDQLIDFIGDETDTHKAGAEAFEAATSVCQKALDGSYLDQLTPEAIAYQIGALPDWIAQTWDAEADDLREQMQDERMLRNGG